ncbi:hypothetical protein BDF22DRAFT_663093 [Syncephalis plumigaleata]|nr:hypothetical protein BDF22DRAFT_663093 [Syncephalis plumigaleata]
MAAVETPNVSAEVIINAVNEDKPVHTRKAPPKPSADEQKTKLADIDAKIEAARKRLNTVKDKIGGKSTGSGKDKSDDKRTKLRNELKEIRDKQAGLKQSRQKVFDQLDAINKSIKSKVADLRAAKDKTPYKNVSEIDAEINKLEDIIQGGRLKLVEEKRAINDITSLRKSRRAVETFEQQQQVIDEEKKRADEVRKQLDAHNNKALSDRYTEIQAELDKLNKANDADRDQRRTLFGQRDEIQKELDELYNSRRALITNYREANDLYYQWQQEDRVRRAEAARTRRHREHEEQIEAEIKEILEMADAPAYILRLKDKTSANVADTNATPVGGKLEVRRIDSSDNAPKGMMLKKKSERDEDDYFVGKKQSAKKSQAANASAPRKEAAVAPFKLPLSVMERFWGIKVDVPTSRDDVSKALEAVQARKQWYLEHQKEATETNRKQAEEKAEELRRRAAEDLKREEEREQKREQKRNEERAAAADSRKQRQQSSGRGKKPSNNNNNNNQTTSNNTEEKTQ